MLVACRLAGLSALEGHYAGVSVSAQFGGAGGCAARFLWGRRTGPSQAPASLNASSGLATKIRRLARKGRRGDGGAATLLGNITRAPISMLLGLLWRAFRGAAGYR